MPRFEPSSLCSSVHLPSNLFSLVLLADKTGSRGLAMAPNIPSAKITLSCPLFGADFDPQDPGLLVVGGGGGEGRSGVGNKIVSLFHSVAGVSETLR